MWPAAHVVADRLSSEEDWLRERRVRFTASDAAALTGDHPWLTKDELFARKLYGATVVVNQRMWFGQMREETNLNIFAALAGTRVQHTTTLYGNDALPWAGATPDGGIMGVEVERTCPAPPAEALVSLPDEFLAPGVVLEAKNVPSKSRSYWKKQRTVWKRGDRLYHYWSQVQFQLMVLGAPRGVLFAAVDAAEMYAHPIEADAGYQAKLREQGEELHSLLLAARF